MTIDKPEQDSKTPAPTSQTEQGTEQEMEAKPDVDHDQTDGLAHKKPEDLTPEELRLMADTMPGEGPGD